MLTHNILKQQIVDLERKLGHAISRGLSVRNIDVLYNQIKGLECELSKMQGRQENTRTGSRNS